MNKLKTLATIVVLVLACGVFLPAARAGAWDQQMKIRFTQPVEIPGRTLSPGTYLFVLANVDSDRHVVEIYNDDWSTLYATIQAIPVTRRYAHSGIELAFAERPHNHPDALLKLFYPDTLTGDQFVYRPKEETELRRDTQRVVLARPHGPDTIIAASGE